MWAIFERTKSFSGFSFLSNRSSVSGMNLWALCLFSMLEIWWQKLRLNYKKLLQWIGQNIRESCLKICNNSDMWIVLCSLGNATKEKLEVSVSRSVMSNSLWPNGLFMGFSRQGYWILLQGIFPTQGSNLGLLHCRQILYHLSYQGSPRKVLARGKISWVVNYNTLKQFRVTKVHTCAINECQDVDDPVLEFWLWLLQQVEYEWWKLLFTLLHDF